MTSGKAVGGDEYEYVYENDNYLPFIIAPPLRLRVLACQPALDIEPLVI